MVTIAHTVVNSDVTTPNSDASVTSQIAVASLMKYGPNANSDVSDVKTLRSAPRAHAPAHYPRHMQSDVTRVTDVTDLARTIDSIERTIGLIERRIESIRHSAHQLTIYTTQEPTT